MKKLIAGAAFAMVLVGCSTQVALVNGSDGRLAKEDLQSFFVSGLGQTQTRAATAICGGADKVVKVETMFSPLNWLLGFLSYGIYTPRDAKIYCK